MIVTVEVDLTRDTDLMKRASTDQKVQTTLMVYDATAQQDETQIMRIGQYLWNECGFVSTLEELCGDDLYGFEQTEALLFTFETTNESACLFRTACHAPAAVKIITRRKIKPEVRFKLD